MIASRIWRPTASAAASRTPATLASAAASARPVWPRRPPRANLGREGQRRGAAPVFDISPIQVIIVLVIALLVFGPKRLPEMGRSIGRGIREFKGAMLDHDDQPPPRRDEDERARPAAAGTVAARDEDDEALEGMVVPGDSPPRPPAA